MTTSTSRITTSGIVPRVEFNRLSTDENRENRVNPRVGNAYQRAMKPRYGHQKGKAGSKPTNQTRKVLGEVVEKPKLQKNRFKKANTDKVEQKNRPFDLQGKSLQGPCIENSSEGKDGAFKTFRFPKSFHC